MSHVLSLIAAKSKAVLTGRDIDDARRILCDAGVETAAPDWLSPGEACDIALQDAAPASLPALRAAFEDRPVDVNIIPAAHRRKKLLVADMDSTLIEQECIDELAAEIGAREQIAAITERAMRGEIAFEPALRERVLLFKDLSAGVVTRLLSERIRIMPGAKTLLATMRAAGAYAALVSGGFTVFAGPIATTLGFDEYRANTLLAEADAFTGLVAEPILGSAAKEEALLELAIRLNLDLVQTLTVGDGANDLAMIRRAGLGVAYRAKPLLRAAAAAAIDHGDLTALLFLQGFRRDELVPAAS